MKPIVRNLYARSASRAGVEEIDPILEGSSFRLESIHSHGQPSPAGFWYDQEGEEWVLLARGSARLEFEGEGMMELSSGDCLLIPAGCRHRIDCVSDDAVWLALHACNPIHSPQ